MELLEKDIEDIIYNSPWLLDERFDIPNVKGKGKGINPTARISYKVTNNKIKEFTKEDINNIKSYLYENNVFQKIILKYQGGKE